MKKNVVGVLAVGVGIAFFGYKRLLKISSRSYKNSKKKDIEELDTL